MDEEEAANTPDPPGPYPGWTAPACTGSDGNRRFLLEDFEVADDALAVDLGIEDQHLHARLQTFKLNSSGAWYFLPSSSEVEIGRVDIGDHRFDIRAFGGRGERRKEDSQGHQCSDEQPHLANPWE